MFISKNRQYYAEIIMENGDENVVSFSNQENILKVENEIKQYKIESFRRITKFRYIIMRIFKNRQYYAKIIMKNGDEKLFSSTSKYHFEKELLSPMIKSYRIISRFQYRRYIQRISTLPKDSI